MSKESLHPGLAISALVLGILALVFSLFAVGALIGVFGLVCGILYIRRHRTEPRGMAVSGIILSTFGLVTGSVLGVLYYLWFGTMLGLVGGPANAAALTSWQGVAAPDFAVTTLDGRELQLSALRGQRVVVDFWATWCGPCIRDMPHFNRLASESREEDLVLVGISKEPRDILQPFVDEHDVVFPIASAGNLPLPYSLVSAIPTSFFIDRNGVIQFVTFGARGYDRLAEMALADDFAGEVRQSPALPAQDGGSAAAAAN